MKSGPEGDVEGDHPGVLVGVPEPRPEPEPEPRPELGLDPGPGPEPCPGELVDPGAGVETPELFGHAELSELSEVEVLSPEEPVASTPVPWLGEDSVWDDSEDVDVLLEDESEPEDDRDSEDSVLVDSELEVLSDACSVVGLGLDVDVTVESEPEVSEVSEDSVAVSELISEVFVSVSLGVRTASPVLVLSSPPSPRAKQYPIHCPKSGGIS